MRFNRLKVLGGEAIMPGGTVAPNARYLPLTPEGLPTDYAQLRKIAEAMEAIAKVPCTFWEAAQKGVMPTDTAESVEGLRPSVASPGSPQDDGPGDLATKVAQDMGIIYMSTAPGQYDFW